MTILDIITYPNLLLKERSKEVENIDVEQELIDNMLKTMYSSNGIGLAAVQVGALKRIVVIDTKLKESVDMPLFMINPVIECLSDKTSLYNEGCLSIPDVHANVKRPVEITVKYTDRQGNENILEADGLLARCIQHEIDHLNGEVFVDKVSKLKKDLALKHYSF